MTLFQRKGWDDLSAGYRARLERKGVTQESHAAGVDLTVGRGKAKEAQLRADLADWKARQRIYYGRKPKEINDAVRGLTKEELAALVKIQLDAENLFDPRVAQKDRPKTAAHRLWKKRNKKLSDWMYYYHGYYS